MSALDYGQSPPMDILQPPTLHVTGPSLPSEPPAAGVQIVGCPASCLSLSTAETLTPGSSVGGRPSSASAVEVVSPERWYCEGETGDHFDPAYSELVRPKCALPGEFRRRKYTALTVRRQNYTALNDELCTRLQMRDSKTDDPRIRLQPREMIQEVAEADSRIVDSASSSTCSILAFDDREVLVEGPLQQQFLHFFWRPRWCVLDRQELRLYQNEQAALEMPNKPLESHSVSTLNVAQDLHVPSVLLCTDVSDEELSMSLRTGPGSRWEEQVASILWLRAFASANCTQH